MRSDRSSPIAARQRKPRLLPALFASAAIGLVLMTGSARADLVLMAENGIAQVGGTGSFDVVLVNTGGTYQVSGFEVELSVASNSHVLFTGVTAATAAPYLFGTLQQPPLSNSTFPTTDFIALDTYMAAPGYVTLSTTASAPQTYGLEHVSFSVDSGAAAGNVPVSIVIGSNTMIADLNGNSLSFTPSNGAITISTSAVPEPSSIVTWTTAVMSLAFFARRRWLGLGTTPRTA